METAESLKEIVRDAFIVFVCSVVSSFIFFHMDGSLTDFLNVLTETKTMNSGVTQIFTDEPGF